VHQFTGRGEETLWSPFSITPSSSVLTGATNVTSATFVFVLQNVSSTRPRSGKDTPPKPRLADQHLWAAVVGSMVLPISVTLVAGKPLSSAWRWMRASSLAR